MIKAQSKTPSQPSPWTKGKELCATAPLGHPLIVVHKSQGDKDRRSHQASHANHYWPDKRVLNTELFLPGHLII